tara:strand:- start:39699 stop:40946 length:1248 start_codon:yes stop_codon:yes gene_type:complete
MDKPISNSEQKKGRIWKWLKISLIPISLILAFLFLRSLLSAKADMDEFRIARVEYGEMENSISATGLVLPSYEIIINSPIHADISAVHFQNGDKVKKGEIILELDALSTKLNYEQLKDELELKTNNVSLLKLQYDKNLLDLEADDTIKGLELQNLESLLKDEQKLQSIGGSSDENLEQAKMRLEIAKWQKKKLENELAYRKRSLEKEKRNLELEVNIQAKKLAELAKKVDESEVKASQDGVITKVNKAIGKKVAEGEELVRIANLNAYKIEASYSDLHSSKVKVGMPVRVRINRVDLTGYIESILPEIENNTIKCNIVLDDDANAALRPNMRVEVFIIRSKKDHVLRVMNGPAFNGGIEQNLFVIKDGIAYRRKLKIGISNTDYVELIGDIHEGEELIISNMKEYEHLTEIKLSE